MKIFVSYSRRDATEFARHIYGYMKDLGHEVFIDTQNIQPSDPWSEVIEENISKCDIFLVIVTPAALRSDEVDKEVLHAQQWRKRIMPCVHSFVNRNNIKWGLERLHDIRFTDKYELALFLERSILTLPSGAGAGTGAGTEAGTGAKAPPLWRRPIILGPIIAAVIIVIVGPVVVPIIQDLLKHWPPERPLMPSFSLNTDKKTYGFGDWVKVSGTLDGPGKTVRLDVYDPSGFVFRPFDSSVSDYVPQTDIQLKPNDKGQYSYRLPTEIPISPQAIRGTYLIEVTYDGVTRNTTFTLR